MANADNIKGSVGEKIRAGKEMAIMSKKLATIIINVPTEFHEEDFSVKEMNKEALKEIFEELEFKTIGKRILGEEINVQAEAWNHTAEPKNKKADTGQMDFLEIVLNLPTQSAVTSRICTGDREEIILSVDKNITQYPSPLYTN